MLRQNPIGQVLEFFRILGVDDLVILFSAVFQLDLVTRGHVLDGFLLTIRFPGIFGRDFLQGRPSRT